METRHQAPRIAATAALLLLVAAAAAGDLPATFHRGVCVEAGPPLEPCRLDELVALGVTHVSLNPFAWMAAPDRPEIRLSTGSHGGHGGRFWGESDEGIRQYADAAHSRGLVVMLRPHVWLRSTSDAAGRSGLWLGDVGFDTGEKWDTFFDAHRELTLHYARLAEETGIAWYSIGAELTRATLEHPDRWRAMIREVRAVYSGRLTYSAGWWKEVEEIAFWEDLDAIGVQAYFPLATEEGSTEEELVAAWQPHLAMLRAVSGRADRPIIFTEIGYRASADAAIRPWEWRSEASASPEMQARCVRAALRAVAEAAEKPDIGEPAATHRGGVIAGVYWWKYHVEPCAAGSRRRRDASFAWQEGPAASIIAEYYAAPPRDESPREPNPASVP